MNIKEKPPIRKKTWIMLAVIAGIILLVVFLVRSFHSFTEFEDDPSDSYATDKGYPPETTALQPGGIAAFIKPSNKEYPPEPRSERVYTLKTTAHQPGGAEAVIPPADTGYPPEPTEIQPGGAAAADSQSESTDESPDSSSEEKGYPPEP